MAKYQNLINSISSVIRTNGNNEITGQILQDVLKSIVNVVGANPTYGGVAHPADNPGTPEGGVVYIASDEGTYVNFGGLTLADNELAVLVWDGTSWSKESVTYIEDLGDIEEAKQEALDAIAEAIQGLNIYYTIETDKGTVKDVQLKDGNGNKLMPRTEAECVEYTDDDGNKKSGEYEFLQLDNVRKSFLNNNREYAYFKKGKYYLPSGALTNSASGFYTTKIPVLDKKDLKIIFKLNLSSTACVVLFFDSSKTLIPTLNIAGGTSRNGIPSMVDLSDEIYENVAYVAFSHFGSGEHYAFLTTESNITDVGKSNIRKYVSFPSTGYYTPSGRFTQSARALNTGFIIIDRSYRFFAFNANLAGTGALILFKDKEGNIISELTIVGEGATVNKTIDMSLPEYDDAFTLCVSNYDNVYGHYAYYTNSDELDGYIANEELYGLRKPSSAPYQGPNILIFGDSITDNCAFTIVDDTTTSYRMKDKDVSYTKDGRTINYNKWPKIIKNKIRPFDIRNYALSGASYKDGTREQGLERQNLSYQIKVALNDISNPNNVFPTIGNYEPDIVILALGTNDQTPNDTPSDAFAKTIFSDGWVDIDATLENLDRTKFCEAARFAFLSLKRAFPKALFLCVLPAQKGSTNRNNELNAALREMAEYHSIRTIDASKEFGILCDFEKSGSVGTYLKDGLHPNDLGQNMYARAIMSFINTYYVDMGAQFDSTY